MTKRVAIVYESRYNSGSLGSSISRAIDLSGFDLKSVNGKKVLLKPNMLGPYPPDMLVTTHPEFVYAVCMIFKQAGAIVKIGDSPSGVHVLEHAWKTTGFADVCKRAGVEAERFEACGLVKKNGMNLSKAVFDTDFVINLPKFKTHSLTILTLGIKNLFGCVNGMQKSACHRIYDTPASFSKMLVNIAMAVKPALTIIDGITAMDGNGPLAGNPHDLCAILAGTDIYCLDAVCSKLVGLNPKELDTLREAARVGLWDPLEEIELTGDDFDVIKPQHFSLPATYTKGMRNWWLSIFITRLIWSNISTEPVICNSRCAKCGLCEKSCPVDAIEWQIKDNPPVINNKKCTQCFCCHEICQHKAIDLKQSFVVKLWRIASTMFSMWRKKNQTQGDK